MMVHVSVSSLPIFERYSVVQHRGNHVLKGDTLYFKGIDYCQIEIIKILIDKGQFQYISNLKGPQVGNYLYTTQFLSLR